MEILDFVRYILIPAILTYVGYNERDKMIQKQKLSVMLPKDDVQTLVEKGNEVHAVEIREIHKDINRLEVKIDKILDRLMTS